MLNPENLTRRQIQYRNNREWELAQQKKYREHNKDQITTKNKEWAERNKEKLIAYRKERYATFPLKYASNARNRKLCREQRVPPWADLNEIEDIYRHAKNLGMVVDHIIPLRGKSVSGLHVGNNLQLLSREDNGKKGNRYVE